MLEQSPSDMANGMGWTAKSHDTPAETTAVQTRKDAKGRMMESIKSTLLAEQKVWNMPLHAHSLESSLNKPCFDGGCAFADDAGAALQDASNQKPPVQPREHLRRHRTRTSKDAGAVPVFTPL
jgi:hypothetical protein